MAEHDMRSFAQLLHAYRRAATLSQETLAERAHLSVDAIAALEHGRRTRPRPATVAALTDALGLGPVERAAFHRAANGEEVAFAPVDTPVVRLASVLPTAPTPLLGREREVAAVTRLLEEAPVRLVTITGTGGIGKTRLVLAVAMQLPPSYEATFFVPLAAISDPELVLPTIAAAVSAPESRNGSALDRIAGMLGARRVLLILDNFEQVIAAAPAVAALLAAVPGITVLITSRERLRLAAEHTSPLPPLPLPLPGETMARPPGQFAQYAAIQLFVARARTIQPGFVLTEENAPVIAAICQRLDGLPLAIELAAARIRLLTPRELLIRLERRLVLLTGGARDHPRRQQTLRDAIDWSYDLLDAGEQSLFRRLAAFADGATLAAVEHVCNRAGDLPVDPLDGLDLLLDKSLIQMQGAAEGIPRVMMLETIREYATERLTASNEARVIQETHARYYLAFAAASEDHGGHVDRSGWHARIVEEQGNLRAALNWVTAHGRVALGLEIAVTLAPFWWARGALHEGRHWLEATLATDDRIPDVLRAKGLHQAGSFAAAQGDLTVAERHYAESRGLLGEDTPPAISAALLGDMGMLALQQGNVTHARTLLHEVLTRQEEAGDSGHLAGTHNRLGLVEMQNGNTAQAKSHFATAITLARTQQDRPILAAALNNYGNLLLGIGETGHAAALFTESVALRRALDDRVGLPISLHSRGDAARNQGDLHTAAAAYAESLVMRRELGDRRGVVRCLQSIAAVALAEGEATRAGHLLAAAETLRAQIGAVMYPWDRDDVEATQYGVRTALGTTMTEVWATGQALTLEEAIQEALGDNTDRPDRDAQLTERTG